ncbi:DUF4442 domain-containing protein [Acidiphilium iwatense]|uniref:DUF4442 domain-containing protein n=1 Tax=Acidiphilium iwatense TaxID=768198 RepID=A0ABS9E0D4_9PROT|nr:DUF4442 domain-containing protein [Acidiphilium iwatense]MCF3948484.1 DUF4442 domain-containing protein [Acidiphilium iwatense]
MVVAPKRKVTPRLMRLGMNLYPPYLFSGIRIDEISPDWRHCRARITPRWFNRNAVGTIFGGTLFALTDGPWALMLMHLLGSDYFIWDNAASIDFIAPGRGRVRTEFYISPEAEAAIRAEAATGDKVQPWFDNDIHDDSGVLVARARRQLYVRLKPRARPA